MKISAVIHTYNRRDLLAETLDAVFSQTRPLDEVLVVDDGSTDGTSNFIRDRYGDRIRLINRENGGCEAAREHGVREASGDWVALCDSDDIWRENHIQRLCELHQAYPEADLLFTNFEEFGPAAVRANKFESAGAEYWQKVSEERGDFINFGHGRLDMVLEWNPVFTSACMFRSSAYKALGGINLAFNGVLASDADLTRRFAIAGSLAADKSISVGIRKTGGNMSANSAAVDLGRIQILQQNIEDGGLFAPFEGQLKAAISNTAERVMQGAFSHRDMKSFRAAAGYVPSERLSASLKIKKAIASLPGFIRGLIFGIYRLFSRESAR